MKCATTEIRPPGLGEERKEGNTTHSTPLVSAAPSSFTFPRAPVNSTAPVLGSSGRSSHSLPAEANPGSSPSSTPSIPFSSSVFSIATSSTSSSVLPPTTFLFSSESSRTPPGSLVSRPPGAAPNSALAPSVHSNGNHPPPGGGVLSSSHSSPFSTRNTSTDTTPTPSFFSFSSAAPTPWTSTNQKKNKERNQNRFFGARGREERNTMNEGVQQEEKTKTHPHDSVEEKGRNEKEPVSWMKGTATHREETKKNIPVGNVFSSTTAASSAFSSTPVSSFFSPPPVTSAFAPFNAKENESRVTPWKDSNKPPSAAGTTWTRNDGWNKSGEEGEQSDTGEDTDYKNEEGEEIEEEEEGEKEGGDGGDDEEGEYLEEEQEENDDELNNEEDGDEENQYMEEEEDEEFDEGPDEKDGDAYGDVENEAGEKEERSEGGRSMEEDKKEDTSSLSPSHTPDQHPLMTTFPSPPTPPTAVSFSSSPSFPFTAFRSSSFSSFTVPNTETSSFASSSSISVGAKRTLNDSSHHRSPLHPFTATSPLPSALGVLGGSGAPFSTGDGVKGGASYPAPSLPVKESSPVASSTAGESVSSISHSTVSSSMGVRLFSLFLLSLCEPDAATREVKTAEVMEKALFYVYTFSSSLHNRLGDGRNLLPPRIDDFTKQCEMEWERLANRTALTSTNEMSHNGSMGAHHGSRSQHRNPFCGEKRGVGGGKGWGEDGASRTTSPGGGFLLQLAASKSTWIALFVLTLYTQSITSALEAFTTRWIEKVKDENEEATEEVIETQHDFHVTYGKNEEVKGGKAEDPFSSGSASPGVVFTNEGTSPSRAHVSHDSLSSSSTSSFSFVDCFSSCPWSSQPVEALRAAAMMANQLNTLALWLYKGPLELKRNTAHTSTVSGGKNEEEWNTTPLSSTTSTIMAFYPPSLLLPIFLRCARQVFDLVNEWSTLLTTVSGTTTTVAETSSFVSIIRLAVAASPSSNAKTTTSKLFGIWMKRVRQSRFISVGSTPLPPLSSSSSAMMSSRWTFHLPPVRSPNESKENGRPAGEAARYLLLAMGELVFEMLRSEVLLHPDMREFIQAFHASFPEELQLRACLYYEEADSLLHSVLTVEVLKNAGELLEKALALCWMRNHEICMEEEEGAPPPSREMRAEGGPSLSAVHAKTSPTPVNHNHNGLGGDANTTVTTRSRSLLSSDLEENTRMIMLKLISVRLALGYSCIDAPPYASTSSDDGRKSGVASSTQHIWAMNEDHTDAKEHAGSKRVREDAPALRTTRTTLDTDSGYYWYYSYRGQKERRPLWYVPEPLEDMVVAMQSCHLKLFDSGLQRNGFFFVQTGIYNILQFARMRLRLLMAVKYVRYCSMQGKARESEKMASDQERHPDPASTTNVYRKTSSAPTNDASRIRIADLISFFSSPPSLALVPSSLSTSVLPSEIPENTHQMILLYPTEVEAMMYWLLPLLKEKWMHGVLYIDHGYLVLARESPFPGIPMEVLRR